MKYQLLILSIFLPLIISAQCTNTFQFPFDNIQAPTYNLSSPTTISTVNFAGDYAIIENLIIGETYIIESSAPGDYITIRDPYDSDVLFAHGDAPFSYTAVGVDLVAVHFNLSDPVCGTEFVSRITRISCTTCPTIPQGVSVNKTNPQATLEVGGEIMISDSNRPPVAGMVRFNSEIQDFEGYNGSKWVSLTQANGNIWGKSASPTVGENQKVFAPDVQEGANLGRAVAIDGEYAVIGARGMHLNGNTFQGAAYIFKNNNGFWELQAMLTANDGGESDLFGTSVDIDGNYVIVGAFQHEIGGVQKGAAYIFKRTGNSWSQEDKLIHPTGSFNDQFSNAVAIHGNYAIVGCKYDDVGMNTRQGSVHVFQRSSNVWNHVQELLASDGNGFDEFGESVSIHENQIVIGTPRKNIGGFTSKGAVYVFELEAANWLEKSQITLLGGNAFDLFGYDVAIQNSYIVIGCISCDDDPNDDKGAALIYKKTGTNWIQESVLRSNANTGNEEYGFSVDISGTTAIVGCYNEDIYNVINKGSAYVFTKSGTNWIQSAKLSANNDTPGIHFGFSVSIHGNTCLVGGEYTDLGTIEDVGAAYFFSKN